MQRRLRAALNLPQQRPLGLRQLSAIITALEQVAIHVCGHLEVPEPVLHHLERQPQAAPARIEPQRVQTRVLGLARLDHDASGQGRCQAPGHDVRVVLDLPHRASTSNQLQSGLLESFERVHRENPTIERFGCVRGTLASERGAPRR